MLEMAEVGRNFTKEQYESEVDQLRTTMLEIQQKLRERKDLAVVVLINGAEGAGKSETMQALTAWMDPRGVEVNAFGPDFEGLGRPPFWRYWMHLPAKGKIGIFFGSWYTHPIVDKGLGRIKKAQFMVELEQINTFERHLSAENVLIIKFWLQITQKAQTERLKKIKKDPDRAWQVTKQEEKLSKHYQDFFEVSEMVLSRTNTAEAPWHVLDSSDHKWRDLAVAKYVASLVDERLKQQPSPRPMPMVIPEKAPKTILDTLDLKKKVTRDHYAQELQALQSETGRLNNEAMKRGISQIVVFEGWDAAGKGGAIRRLTKGIDARNYQVVSIAAPTEEERVKPYLWRFWRKLPFPGRMLIFDRSWYGRVLVERVEGFCRPEDWQRAYSEINDFESQLVDNGDVVIKYWLHMSAQEQLRRFKERATTEYKKYKLTDEDWRNRDKWNAYLLSASDMFTKTSTLAAPWSLIEAEDKLTGRLQVLAVYRDRLRDALKKSKAKRGQALSDQ
ncbi:MAG: polyphosphate:AMP phosphotransferase [Myxococcota bacterium]|jgi:polyphosphate:AMP phosphotransferase